MSFFDWIRPGSRVRGVGVLAVAQAISMLCGLGTITIWARWMPQDTFGEFRVLIAIVTFVAAFCLVGTGQAAIMSAARGADGNFSRLLQTKLFANLIASLVLLGTATVYAWGPGGSSTIALALLASALVFPIYNSSDIWMSWVNGKRRFDELAVGRVLTAGLAMIAILISAAYSIAELWIVALLYLGFGSLLNLAMLSRTYGRLENNAVDKSIATFGNHSSVAMTFSGLLALDVVVLNQVYSPQEVAVYAIALQFPEMLKRVYSVLESALAPRVYAASGFREIWQDIRSPFRLITGGAIIVGIAGFFLLPPLTEWLFTERYAHAAEFGRWLWLTIAVCFSSNLLGTALLATKRPVFVYIPYLGYPLGLIALSLALVGEGVLGLTIARVISIIALSLFYVGGFIYCAVRKADGAARA